MIFIINETGKPLKLKSTETDDKTVLSVLVADAELPIIETRDSEIGAEIMKRFAKPEAIRNQRSKYNFHVDGKLLLIEQPIDAELEDSENLGCQLVSFDRDDLPARYTTSKDLVAVVHSQDKQVYMHTSDLTYGLSYEYTSERNEYGVILYPIKWYDWSRLHGPVSIYMDDSPIYQLSSMPHKEIEGRNINVVRDLRKTE